MLHVGFNQYVSKNKVLKIKHLAPVPLARLRKTMKGNTKLIDCTNGEGTNSMIFMESGHVVASVCKPAMLKKRWGQIE